MTYVSKEPTWVRSRGQMESWRWIHHCSSHCLTAASSFWTGRGPQKQLIVKCMSSELCSKHKSSQSPVCSTSTSTVLSAVPVWTIFRTRTHVHQMGTVSPCFPLDSQKPVQTFGTASSSQSDAQPVVDLEGFGLCVLGEDSLLVRCLEFCFFSTEVSGGRPLQYYNTVN